MALIEGGGSNHGGIVGTEKNGRNVERELALGTGGLGQLSQLGISADTTTDTNLSRLMVARGIHCFVYQHFRHGCLKGGSNVGYHNLIRQINARLFELAHQIEDGGF